MTTTRVTLVQGDIASSLLSDARRKLRSGSLAALLLELCSEKDSALGQRTPHKGFVLRITEADDLSSGATEKA